MKIDIKIKSYFKDEKRDHLSFNNWVTQLESLNKRKYRRIIIKTTLGRTQIWGINTENATLPSLVIFPGARTTSLIWDFDRGLDHLGQSFRIFLVETNGLPNLSEGWVAPIKSLYYGYWAGEVLEHLGLEKSYVAGASFGGLICAKLGITNPEKVKACFLLNPGCLQPFSLSPANLLFNLLPILWPTKKNISLFLNKAVFAKPGHSLSKEAEKMLIDYESLALRRYKDHTSKPYFMASQLADVHPDTYLLLGEKDLLFPYKRSMANAKKYLPGLRDIQVFKNVAHGIETYTPAIRFIGETIRSLEFRSIFKAQV